MSRYTVEEDFAANRQQFLAEQGYKYSIQHWNNVGQHWASSEMAAGQGLLPAGITEGISAGIPAGISAGISAGAES